LSEGSGLETIYTAPDDGHDCPGDATITLSCGGKVMDTLVVSIDYNYSISFDYGDPEATIDRNSSIEISVTANNTPLTWSVSGNGFSLEHAETEGTENTLYASNEASGTAKITVTGCDEQQTTGDVLCTSGVWALCEAVPVTRCEGDGNCFSVCNAYVGSGSWIKRQFKVTHASLFCACSTGDDNPSSACGGETADVSSITNTTGPYLAHGSEFTDNKAYFYFWGSE